MRLHAKASSTGSPQRQATGLGRFVRGAFATPGASSDADGSGASPGRRLAPPAALAAALLAGLALLVGAADAAAPVVVTGSASAIAKTAATLNGTVNPEGTELEECLFEYGETGGYGQTAACAETPAEIGAATSPVAVHADVGGLEAATEYHFRFVAVSEDGEEKGLDKTFATLGPLVSGESAGQVGTSTAKLNAAVNPQGVLTTYHFEYTDDADFQANGFANATVKPAPDASAGSGEAAISVSVAITGLESATTYHFRLVATSADGTTDGTGASFMTFTPSPSFGSCPNDPFRTGAGGRLPDCRAYEQASPVEKDGGDANGDPYYNQASPSGDAVSFYNRSGLPGGVGAQDRPAYVARRGADGWSTRGIFAPPVFGERLVSTWGLTPDLQYSFQNFQATSPGEPLERDFVSRSNLDGTVEFIVPFTQENGGYQYGAASADDSRVFFEAAGAGSNLTGNGVAGRDNVYLYDRGSGTLSLVGLLPESEGGAAPPEGSVLGPYDWFAGATNATHLREGGPERSYLVEDLHAVSMSGDRAFFTAGGTGEIYLRRGLLGAGPETVPVSASQATSPDPNGSKPAIFMGATPSGSQAFFTSCEKLTDDSTSVSTAANRCDAAEQGSDLYRYDAGSGALADLTVDTNADPHGADVRGVIGVSDDGTFVYFVANGVLASNVGAGGAHATLGDCGEFAYGGAGLTASGSCNLYVWHSGAIAFVAPLKASSPEVGGYFSDAADWAPTTELISNSAVPNPTGRVSPDGRTLLIRSQLQLTGYDNSIQLSFTNQKAGANEFYRFRFGDSEPACVSCTPTGASPEGRNTIESLNNGGAHSSKGAAPLRRVLSADGDRVFFEADAKLVGGDVDGTKDVYEWEAPGAGSCTAASSAYSIQDEGCLYLLSSGASSSPSYLLDASSTGDDVFIITREALVPQDEDGLKDVYDVRAGGGLASQHAVAPPQCEGEACRGAGTGAASGRGAGSAAFSGPGNQAQAHLRNCGPVAGHAQRLAHRSKRLRRRAGRLHGRPAAQRLRHRARLLAKRAHRLSMGAKRCRRANRRASR